MASMISICALILQNSLLIMLEPIFWFVLLLVAFQYRQQQRNQEYMFGVAVSSWKRQLWQSLWLGILGGCLGSMLLTLVGVTVNNLGLAYIWPLAIALMLLHTRFLCFAYAGGLVAVSAVLFGWPEVNVPHILALVAVLHITESILIAISGRVGAVPVFLRRDHQLVGAFMLQNFWPLPLSVLFIAAMAPTEISGSLIATPSWWPLLPVAETAPDGKQWVHMLYPVAAALGYADIAVSTPPAIKRRQSACYLLLYSLVLLVFAILCSHYSWLALPAALLSPVGHEFIIWLQNRRELSGQPLFTRTPGAGLTVLAAVPGSPAAAVGLRAGDQLLFLYDMPLTDEYTLAEAILYAPRNFSLCWRRGLQVMEARLSFVDGERTLGIILTPQGHERYVELETESFAIFKRLRRLFGRL